MAPSTPQGLLVGSKREHPFPLWHPHSTVSNQLTLYPLANLVPFTGNTSTSPLLWRASRTHSLHSSSQLDTHKDTKLLALKSLFTRVQAPESSEYINQPNRAASQQLFIGRGAAYSSTCSANQLQALCLLYFGIPAFHTPPLLKFNY